MIKKEKFPILELSTQEEGILTRKTNTVKTSQATPFPERAIFAFLKEGVIKDFVKKYGGRKICMHHTVSKRYPIYQINFKGRQVCICQGAVGSAVASEILDWMIGHGVKKIVACGSCGALDHFEEGEFLIPTKALRDEGASYKYLPPARFVELNKNAIKVIEETMREKELKYKECFTWSTDGFFRETAEMIDYRKSEGCNVVDMECSALAAVAEFRKVEFGQVLFTADSLADVENYDARGFGRDAHESVLELCFDIVLNF